jgi:hypothetical protein
MGDGELSGLEKMRITKTSGLSGSLTEIQAIHRLNTNSKLHEKNVNVELQIC